MSTDGRDLEIHLAEEFEAGRLTRAELIQRASVLGVSLAAIGAWLGTPLASARPAAPSISRITRGGTARIGMYAPVNGEPLTTYDDGGIFTMQCAGEYLCFSDPRYVLQPKLATAWKPNADLREWTFTIRQGVRWHDGSPFTTEDVLATFERATDSKSGASALSIFKGVLSQGQTERVDEKTIRFHLDRPFADFPYLVSSFNYGTVILPKNYEMGTFVKGGIGTGPFILQAVTPTQGATLVRNPNYWAPGLPYLDGLNLTYYGDAPPIVLAMQAGEVDVFPNPAYQGSQALFENSNIRILQSPSSARTDLNMRADRKPFTDVRVRQAVALCIDRPGVINALFKGRATVGNDHGFAPVFPASSLANGLAKRRQNYSAARALLAAAGHSRGLELTLSAPQQLELPQYAVLLKQQLKPAGIDVKLDIQSLAKFFASVKRSPWLEVPFGIVTWAPRPTASQLTLPAFRCGAVWNSAHWCNRNYDKLMKDFDAEADEQRRAQLARQAAMVQRNGAAVAIAHWKAGLRAVRKNVNGLAAGPNTSLDPSRMWLA